MSAFHTLFAGFGVVRVWLDAAVAQAQLECVCHSGKQVWQSGSYSRSSTAAAPIGEALSGLTTLQVLSFLCCRAGGGREGVWAKYTSDKRYDETT